MKSKLVFTGAACLLAILQVGCAGFPSGRGRVAQGGGNAHHAAASDEVYATVGHCTPIAEQPQSRHYSHKYRPHFAHKTLCPSPCRVQAPYYGFHTTCWSAWPAGWQNCELPCGSGGEIRPGELEFAEPVEPLPAGDDEASTQTQDEGDAESSPSDVPPPTAGDDAPPTLPAEDEPALEPAAPAEDRIEAIPADPVDEEEEEDAADELPPALEPPPAIEPAPAQTPPPTSSRPRPLRSAERPMQRESTATIVEIEDELEQIDVPTLHLSDDSGPLTQASKGTVRIVEVSPAANVEPIDAIGDPSVEQSAPIIRITPAAARGAKAIEPTTAPGPVRKRISDDSDEEVRPVNWIDSFLETTDR